MPGENESRCHKGSMQCVLAADANLSPSILHQQSENCVPDKMDQFHGNPNGSMTGLGPAWAAYRPAPVHPVFISRPSAR